MKKIIITEVSTTKYSQWYRKRHPELYSEFGKSILAIDKVSFKVQGVFKTTEVRESISFCIQNGCIHQFCDAVFYGETELLR